MLHVVHCRGSFDILVRTVLFNTPLRTVSENCSSIVFTCLVGITLRSGEFFTPLFWKFVKMV